MKTEGRRIAIPRHAFAGAAGAGLLAGVAIATLGAARPAQAQAQAVEPSRLDVEIGAAWSSRNDVQAPNDGSGTRFAIDRITGDGPVAAPRIQFSTGLAPRHELRLVAAPLRLSGSGNLDGPVRFEGRAFAAGGAQARYRFDSYRATWRYTLHDSGPWTLKLGVTGKIRDAEISLTQAGATTTRSDTGFVPLLHAYAERRLDNRSRLVFEGDGLIGGRGYALDVTARYMRDIGERTSLFAGVRLLDGGVDASGQYNFARFHYVTTGLVYRF
jgi:hypothetical protein